MEKLTQFIHDLREEKGDYRFDQPWRLEENSLNVLVPILRKNKIKRKYITFSEAREIEVNDTGQIDYVQIKNNESKPVLVCRGDIFRGKTQERAAIHDYIIPPTKSIRVSVRCIHHSKGISGNAKMEYGGKVSGDIDLSNQEKTWNTVREQVTNYYSTTTTGISGSMHATNGEIQGWNIDNDITVTYDTFSFDNPYVRGNMRTGNDNYVGMIDDVVDNMREAMKKLPPIKNQVGVVFFGDNDLKGLEIYDSPDSWTALKEDVISKEGSSFLNKDDENLFEFRPKAAKKLIKKKLNVSFTEKYIYNKEYKLIEVKSDKYIGEGLIWKDHVVHLSIWKKHK